MLVVYISNDKVRHFLLHVILKWCHYMHCSSCTCTAERGRCFGGVAL